MAAMTAPDLLCIGSCLWDVIGRSPSHMRLGADVPGRITRVPGGVAMNIAMTLRRFGLRPALLTAIGRDAAGDELVAEAGRLGLDMPLALPLGRPADRPLHGGRGRQRPDRRDRRRAFAGSGGGQDPGAAARRPPRVGGASPSPARWRWTAT